MNNLPQQKLKEIIIQYGRSLCDEPQRCEALLRDYCGQYKREIFLLVSALKQGVAKDLLSSSNVPAELLLGRLIKQMQNDLGLTEEAARYAVEGWAQALGKLTPKETKPTPPTPLPTPSPPNPVPPRPPNPTPPTPAPEPQPSPFPQPVKKRVPKHNYKRIGLIAGGIVLLGLGGTQLYGYLRLGVLPVNPILVIRSLPSSRFLQKTLTTTGFESFFDIDVAISPNGKTIVSGGHEKDTIKIWDLATGKELHTLKANSYSVVISPDGQKIVSGSYQRINIWDLTTGKLLRNFIGYYSLVNKVAVSPDGNTLVSVGNDTIINGIVKDETFVGINLPKINLELLPKVVINLPPIERTKESIKIWDLATGRKLHTLESHAYSIAISPDGQTILSGSGDNTIKIWHLATGKLLHTLTDHSEILTPVWSVAIRTNGKTLVSGSYEKTIKIWDLATEKLLHTLTGHSNSVNSVAISPDGQTIVSGSGDNTIKVWDLATGKLLHTLIGHSDSVRSVAISPNGQTIVSGSADNTIKIWRLER